MEKEFHSRAQSALSLKCWVCLCEDWDLGLYHGIRGSLGASWPGAGGSLPFLGLTSHPVPLRI